MFDIYQEYKLNTYLIIKLLLQLLLFYAYKLIIYLILEENDKCGDANSSWVSNESSANTKKIYPTLTTKLICCLKYLVSTGKEPEVCSLFNIKYNKNI